jgi:hypothetical protein
MSLEPLNRLCYQRLVYLGHHDDFTVFVGASRMRIRTYKYLLGDQFNKFLVSCVKLFGRQYRVKAR